MTDTDKVLWCQQMPHNIVLLREAIIKKKEILRKNFLKMVTPPHLVFVPIFKGNFQNKKKKLRVSTNLFSIYSDKFGEST